jgi:transcriptional regulator with XRE-family HTH domain
VSDEFGKKIRDRRIAMGLTLEELADQLGTKKNYVWQLENKAPARPSGQLLLKLSDVLELPPDFLLDDEKDDPDAEQMKYVLWRKSKIANLSEKDMGKLLKMMAILKDED